MSLSNNRHRARAGWLVGLEDALPVVEGGEVAGVDLLEHALARQGLLWL